MKRISCVVISLLIIVPAVFHATYYKVQPNDSLWNLSKKFNVPSETITKLNELYKEYLFEGQTLYIPDTIIDYSVQSGDNLSVLAQTFHTRVQYIIIFNNLADTELTIGQNLRIPAHRPEKRNTGKKINYTVKRGDNLSQIAQDHGVSMSEIKTWNQLQDDSLQAEQILIIYSSKSVSEPIQVKEQSKERIWYTVRSGDNLENISERHGCSVSELKKWNNRTNDTIFIGEKLAIYKNKIEAKPVHKVVKHRVQPGDHLSGLAKRYGVSIQQIKTWNKLKRDTLFKDELLTIHATRDNHQTARPLKKQKITYTVQRGDNLSAIAQHYKVSVNQIMTWNKKSKKTIYAGEKLVLFSNTKAVRTFQKVKVKDPGLKVDWSEIKVSPVPTGRVSHLSQTDKGLILHLSQRTGIRSIADGVVEFAGFLKTKNNVVIINLGQGKRMVYGYLQQVSVTTGQKVKAGDYIGIVDYLSIHHTRPLLIEMFEGKKSVDIFSVYPGLRKKRFVTFK